METIQEENIVEEVGEAEIGEVPAEEVEKYLEQEKEQEENNVNIEMQVDNGKVENE